MPRFRILAGAGLALLLVAACSPTLDWREVRPQSSGALAMFPCRPASHARRVELAGATVALTMHACNAGGATWALAFADVADPARVAVALLALRTSALANLGAVGSEPIPGLVPGATPNVQSGRVALVGKLPDGTPVHEHLAVFAKGTRVFQATVLGAQLDAQALDNFFGALRLPG